MIDTRVWLDLPKDPRAEALLNALEELVDSKEVVLILPTIISEEFSRNRSRIIQEGGKRLSSGFKNVKEVVSRFSPQSKKKNILNQLNDLDAKIPHFAEEAADVIHKIESLFEKATIISNA